MFSADRNEHRLLDIRDVWVYDHQHRHKLMIDIRLSTEHSNVTLWNCFTRKGLVLNLADPNFFERLDSWMNWADASRRLMAADWDKWMGVENGDLETATAS